jgi:hypothetical protein
MRATSMSMCTISVLRVTTVLDPEDISGLDPCSLDETDADAVIFKCMLINPLFPTRQNK